MVGSEGEEGVVAGTDEGGRSGQGGMGEGVYAYHIEYKTTTTALLSSSSSSLISLRRVRATSLTATRSRSAVESFLGLRPWVRVSLSSVGVGYAVVRGHWSFDSRCWWSSLLPGGRCRSLGAGRRLPLAVFAYGCRLGGCRILRTCVCLVGVA